MCAKHVFESHGAKRCLLKEKYIELQFTEHLIGISSPVVLITRCIILTFCLEGVCLYMVHGDKNRCLSSYMIHGVKNVCLDSYMA